MTGYDLYLRAAAMLGLTAEAAEQTGLLKQACRMVTELCLDLGAKTPETVSEELQITPAQEDALIYGIAMLMAIALGDSAANRFYTGLYNAKRARALARTDRIADVLPRDNGGVRS